MTKDDIERRITELEAERQKMNASRVDAEKALAVKQAEAAELTRAITENTWETTTKAKELERMRIAYGYTNDDVYTRHLYGGTWSSWGKV